ncbi:MAG TPA: PEP/pyruvate-binding domain-containing protein [Solirubrobacteraceae bacterium]|nr:PEP/pyruvate-binding domain-containing protein [Solirubrobacteraceae bacterium]
MTTAPSTTFGPPDIVPVKPLSDLSTADVRYAGEKGANLGQLTRLGLRVPPGFVIGAPAYAAFRHQSGLAERLEEVLGKLDVESTEALRAASEEARRAVADAEMPAWLAYAIAAAYDELSAGEPHVAVVVRSSAPAEDTASASFAGMNETFLNVQGREAVIDAVRRCWQSLFEARTVYYRGQRGFGQTDTDIAVVVQHQIPSTRAGVMFTIDPASGDRDHLVIEGSFGLRESVVSGQVSPDRYVVEKPTMSILVRSVRPKELTIEVGADGGTTRRELSTEESRRAVLGDEEVLRLAELGIAVEREYGSAQETEWAFDPDGMIWVLSSRPFTTLGAATSAGAGGSR